MTTSSRKTAAAVATSLAALLALTACGAEQESAAESITGSCDDVDLSTAPAEPVTIRLGGGLATEEPQWALVADPESVGAEHAGTWYTVEGKSYVPNDRLDAYQAGQLDAGTISPPQLVRAVAQGLDLRAVASLKREAEGGFNTQFVALEDSGIEGPEDLKGKKIGILSPTTSTDYWAKSAVAGAGLDPTRDVEYVSIPFPQQEEALRAGTIDVAVMVRPFYQMAQGEGGLQTVFTALTGPGIDQELILTWFDASFVEENPEAFCAFRSDLVGALEAYQKDPASVAQAAIDGGFLPAPDGETLASTEDWVTPEGGEIDLEALDAMIENMQDIQFIGPGQAMPAEDLVLKGYSLVQ
jgi:ABC-type phosphate/phosphonate transport system substrate-binding protein